MSRRNADGAEITAGPVEPAGNALERLVEQAVEKDAGHAAQMVEALRQEHPTSSPADLIAILEQRYTRRVKTVSALIGLSAAVPGVGTGVAAVLTAVNVATFLRVSTGFIGAVAHIHAVPLEDVARRRTLLLVSLLGEDGARALHSKLGVSSLYWGRGVLTRLPLGTVRAVNKRLSRRLVRTFAAKGGVLALGRLAPFGIGAVVGWFVGRSLARQVTTGARDAFGPPPAE